jgi:hypothetical protein
MVTGSELNDQEIGVRIPTWSIGFLFMEFRPVLGPIQAPYRMATLSG